MVKLVIQIPYFNEEATLALPLGALPRAIHAVERIETLVIDDGNTDRMLAVARAEGVDHIVELARYQGLARGVIADIVRALEEGADVIVNTAADNQCYTDDIPCLIAPVLAGRT